MARRTEITAHAQQTIQLAQVAHFWGLIPIPLEYKTPKIGGWPNKAYATAVDDFIRRVYSLSPIDQERLNVGVLTGLVAAPNPIVVVDIDKKNGGLTRWARWRAVPE